MKRQLAAGMLFLLCALPLTAGAAGEMDGMQRREPEVRYSSYYSSEVREKSARSMVLFNYGRGK